MVTEPILLGLCRDRRFLPSASGGRNDRKLIILTGKDGQAELIKYNDCIYMMTNGHQK